METENTRVRIYSDRASSAPGSHGREIFVLGLGIVLSALYVHRLPREIAHDFATFPASYKSFPLLTVILSVFVACAYVIGGCLCAVMVYIPARNLLLPRRIEGRLLQATQVPSDDEATLGIRIGANDLCVHDRGRIQFRRRHLQVRDLDNLRAALSDEALQGCNIRLKVGAFNRVLSVDKICRTA